MKNLIRTSVLTTLLLSVSISIYAQQIVTLPQASPRAEFSQTFGITTVTINYGAPKVKVGRNDRTGKIWGQQVPYGFQKRVNGPGEVPWRAGANQNTTISFSTDVKVEGKEVPAGTYGLHMVIHEDQKATIILSENHSSWGSFSYDPNEDVIRADVSMEEIPFQNVLNYSAIELDGLFTKLALSWDNQRIPFKVEANTVDIVTTNLKNELRNQQGFGWLGRYQAAAYLARFNHEPALAMEWVNESITAQKNFQNMALKVTILFRQGKMEEVMSVLDETAQLADINQLNALAAGLLQNNLTDKAIEFYELNVKRNPTDPGVHSNLGSAYKTKGDNKKAIKMLKKSNTLNPSKQIEDSNNKLLEELGVKKN